MQNDDDLLRLVLGANALTRVASLETRNEAPAAQWRTLSLLREHGPQRIGDLAALSRVTQPGMTRLVAQMADAGLLERGHDEHDSRATVVTVTPAGLAALDEWIQVLGAALAPRFSDLDADDWAAIRRAADVVDARTRTAEVSR
ncbi:MarR family transcriptional regulator [Microbacterium sp. F2E]|uniref:MarR family winged helix-turn-helix transcriptional regulator n=1 Tax=Microbacterium sp. F2E TaxID=2895284 RepID=UPI001E43D90A|nr:MarR family transcriptional regulator [Microbacterium sp. F2E]MCC9053485.1 MarR family transcriptional regulator [Microbacterium sp. F2E]